VDPGGGRDRGVWASERVYRALIRLYPEEVRRRYAEEMIGYFGDLCREEWHSSGVNGMVLLWARTLPDLVFSVLKERGTNFLRGAYLPMAPGTAARWGALSALLGGSLGVAYSLAYILANIFQLDWLWRGWATMPVHMFATLLSILGMFGLYGTLVARSGRPDALALSGATLAALSAISFSAHYAYITAEMLGWLWPSGEGMSWWEMYRIELLEEVGMGACVLGLLLLGASVLLKQLQPLRGVPQVFEEVLHLADALASQVLAALQDEEVRDLLPQALRVPDGGPYVGHVVFGADHGKHARDAHGAEVVEADRVLQKYGLRCGAARHARRVAFDRLDHSLARMRGKIPVLQDAPGHHSRTLGVVGRFPPGVGFVEANVVQEGGGAQYLLVVGDLFRGRELLREGVDPQAVGVPVDWVCPYPGDERLYLLHHRPHGRESSE
jgi:hypothetical protein